MSTILFYIAYGVIWLLTLLPMPVLYLKSDFLYFIIFHIIGYRKKVVYRNLQNAFPDKDKDEIDKIARNFYKHFCDIIFETLKELNMSKAEMMKRVRYINSELINKYFNQRRSIIAVVGHYCNWEWLTGFSLQTPYHGASLYKPLNNNQFNKVFGNMRSKFGTEMIPMKQALRSIIKNKRENRLTINCYISDQSPVREELDYFTRFLNQDTAVFLGIEKLAVKFNLPVVYFKMKKIKRGYYEVEILDISGKPTETAPNEITEKHVRLLEETILEEPAYWLWSHRRWKFKPSDKLL